MKLNKCRTCFYTYILWSCDKVLEFEKYKGRGVTILVRKNYIEKCLNKLDTKHFRKLSKDPT